MKTKVSQPKVRIVRRMGRPMLLPGVWGEIANKLGGVNKLSEAVCLSVRQVRRLAKRESPLVGPARVAMEAIAKRLELAREFQDWCNG
jgi:hypothetical protein